MLYFAVIIANFINARISKQSTLIPFIGMAVLSYLAANAGELGSVDYATYSRGYTALSYSSTSQFEWGYTLLEKYTILCNLDYDQFRGVIFAVSFLALFLAIKVFTGNVSEFVWLFAIFPFINEANQVRNFAMIAFGILALSLYATTQKLLLPSILIIISASFHSLGYLFVLIILFSKVVPKMTSRALMISGGIGLTASLFLSLFSSYTGFIGTLIAKIFILIGRSDGSNSNEIYNAYGSGSGSSTKVFLLFLIIFALIIIYCLVMNNKFSDVHNQKVDILIIAAFIVSFIGILSLPASIQNQRVLRNSITLLLILHSILNSLRINNQFKNDQKTIFFANVLIVIIMVISVNSFDGGYFSDNSVIQPTIGYLLELMAS